jgi:hypothetical protein
MFLLQTSKTPEIRRSRHSSTSTRPIKSEAHPRLIPTPPLPTLESVGLSSTPPPLPSYASVMQDMLYVSPPPMPTLESVVVEFANGVTMGVPAFPSQQPRPTLPSTSSTAMCESCKTFFFSVTDALYLASVLYYCPGITKVVSITEPLTSCFTGLELVV